MPAPDLLPIPALSESRLEALLQALPSIRVTVLGDLILDRYLHGSAERISPEAPVPVVHVKEEVAVPGGAANVAVNLSRMGAHCDLIGVTGSDPEAARLRQELKNRGVADSGLIDITNRPTTTKTRLVAQGQQVVRIDREVATLMDQHVENLILTRLRLVINRADALVIEDYDKGVLSPRLITIALELASEQGIPVIVDPKSRHFFHYSGATLFKPNRRELEQALGQPVEGSASYQSARERLDVENLLITLGAEGMVLISRGQEPHLAPSLARAVFDVSGAGDTVTAWAGATLAAGGNANEAAWMATLAAGVVVEKRGTATVSTDELRRAWHQRYQQS